MGLARLEVVGTRLPEKEVKGVIINSLSMRLRDVERAMSKLRSRLGEFEAKYGFSSKEFAERRGQGAVGDDVDFLEWESCLVLLEKLSKEKAALTEILQ
jgi:hypothetical protein